MYTILLHLTALQGDRDRALALVRAATGLPPLAAHSVVLTTDATATAVLRAAGIPPEDARPILATLWPQVPRPAEPRPGSRPRGQDATGQREQHFMRDLGQRIHVIRQARQLTPTGVRHRTGIPPYLLRDLEAGDLWPSSQHLYRLAQAFAVPLPLPLLVDDNATPVADLAAAVRPDRLSHHRNAWRNSSSCAPLTLRYS